MQYVTLSSASAICNVYVYVCQPIRDNVINIALSTLQLVNSLLNQFPDNKIFLTGNLTAG